MLLVKDKENNCIERKNKEKEVRVPKSKRELVE